jgi:hypothetical protein
VSSDTYLDGSISGNVSSQASVDGYINGTYDAYFDGYYDGSSEGNFIGNITGCYSGNVTGNFTGWVGDDFCGDIQAWVGGYWYSGRYCGDLPNNTWIDGYIDGQLSGVGNCYCDGWTDGAYVDGWFNGSQSNDDFCGNVTGWFSGYKDGYFEGTLGAEGTVEFDAEFEGWISSDSIIWYEGYMDTMTQTVDPGAAIPAKFIESDSITVKQMEVAALMIANISYPTQLDVCTNFTVDAIVKNISGVTAEDVVATLHISDNLDASVVGSLTVSLGNIAGGGFELVSWVVHCDGAGSGAIAVSADGDNTTPAVAGNGSVIQVAVPVPQPCLAVEVDAPAQVTVEQSYYITAVVSNPCDGEACDVIATIAISGNAALASGESAAKNLGCIDAGDSVAVDWEVNCTDVGGVNITVSAKGTGTNTAIDGVAVQQVVFQDILEALESIDARIVGVRGDIASGVATISTGLTTIQTSLGNLNATVTSIDDGVATIETNLVTLKGTVADISDGVATIVTDLGTVKADVSQIADDSGTLKSRSIWTLPILILVAIGAIALIVGVAIVASRKRPVPVVIERKGEE